MARGLTHRLLALLTALEMSEGASAAPPEATRPRSATSVPSKGLSPDPLARRLCDALHALPAERKNQCCGTGSSHLANVCSEELSVSLRTGAVGLDAAAIDRCAAETSRQLEGCDWVTPLAPSLPEACQGLVRGRLKPGARCRSSLECGDGLYCRGVSPTAEGVCAAPAAPRTRCEVPADNLAAFARARDDARHPSCDGLCLKGQCLPFAAAGGTCTSGAQCLPGLHCIGGRCEDRPLPKRGEPCLGKTCGAGAFCDAGRCAALKGEGAPCALPFECRALACVTSPAAKVGKCGAPCRPTSAAAPR
jgi:hypothetical protein